MTPAPALAETARVRLRALREDDLPAFQAYRHDPEVGRWQGWSPTDDDTARAFLREVAALPFCPPGVWCQIAIAARDTDALLGDIGLHLAADGTQLEIGYTLARHAQGRGLAQEAVGAALALAFAHTPARCAWAISDTRNGASLRLLPRLGFRAVAAWPAQFRGQACTEQAWVLHAQPAPPLRLRPARADAADAAAVAEVLLKSRAQLMPYAPHAHADDGVRHWVREVLVPGGGVTLAEAETPHGVEPAGVLATALDGEGRAWIEQLYVHPLHVARGVGTALLRHALATLPRPVWLHTFQPNTAARAFYARHGFVEEALGDGRDNEERVPDVRLRRDAA